MSTETDIAIQLKNVSKTYRISDIKSETIRDRIFSVLKGGSYRSLQALSDIDFSIKKGEFFGIIGHNGSGKSTLINVMSKAIPPDKGGLVERNGSYLRLSLGMGFNPELTARQNITLNASILGMPLSEIKARVPEIVAFAEIERFIDTPVKFFSKGMRARLTFSVAIYAEADILFMDEIFGGVGDERFKKKADIAFRESMLAGRTVVHVSHSMKNIEDHFERVLVLNQGKMVTIAPAAEAIQIYRDLIGSKLDKKPSKSRK